MQDRLQKIISASGLMSRRAAEKLISEGKVTVNGVVAELGDKADIDLDEILVNGEKLEKQAELVYIVLNKPKGYVTTMSDEKGRKNVAELVEEAGVRVYPVGRLDINSEGLLIMTNDGELANHLMHPSGNVYKTYRVWVKGDDMDTALSKLSDPIDLDGYTVKAKNVKTLKKDSRLATVDITIGEGRNRQVRRMCDYAGLYVTRLCRIKEGPITIGSLKSGEWRYLDETEVQSLYRGESK